METTARLDQNLLDRAKGVLYGNLKIGYSSWAKDTYKYISPSPKHYPHQWFWDSCFHAIVLSHFDILLAKNEIRNLLKAQREDGFIPHAVFWNRRTWIAPSLTLESKMSLSPKTTQLIQPPLLAEAVEAIFEKERDEYFLEEVLPKLSRYYRWLAENRDPDQDGLISIIAPYESGLDQSPSFDEVCDIRSQSPAMIALGCRKVTFKNMIKNYNLEQIFAEDYFNVEDVLVNSVYIKNLFLLSSFLDGVGNSKEAQEFGALAEKAQKSLLSKCFDENKGFFYDLSSREEKKLNVLTIKGLIPIILDIPKQVAKKLVESHINNKSEFDLAFPLPSVAKSEPSFRPVPSSLLKAPNIWRGPTWINMNWYVAKGLKKHGFKKEAEKIIEKSADLVRSEGYREFYNPLTGQGYGAHNFGWSTLVVDMILN